MANVLTGVRLAVTVPFLAACAAALAGASPGIRILPLLLFAVAALTDLLDGLVARRQATASGRGQLLDHTADVVFIGSSLLFFAGMGRLSWWVPLAVAASVAAYYRALWRDARAAADVRLARSALGHAAGVVNYMLVGLLAAGLTLPGAAPEWLVGATGWATAGINALAVLGRLLP
jgi:phosphatidylglycerophosphate synthase